MKIRNKGEEIFRVDTNGDVFAKNAFLQDGFFTGDIITPIIHYSTKNFGDECLTISKNKNVKENYIQHKGYSNKYVKGFCFYKNKVFNAIQFSMKKKGFVENFILGGQ